MALIGLIRRLPAISVFRQPVIVPPINLKGLNSSPVAVFALPPFRNYMKNFEVNNLWLNLGVVHNRWYRRRTLVIGQCLVGGTAIGDTSRGGTTMLIGWPLTDILRRVFVFCSSQNFVWLLIKYVCQVKQRRKTGYEQRMQTEGGRRILLRKILRGKDVLGGES